MRKTLRQTIGSVCRVYSAGVRLAGTSTRSNSKRSKMTNELASKVRGNKKKVSVATKWAVRKTTAQSAARAAKARAVHGSIAYRRAKKKQVHGKKEVGVKKSMVKAAKAYFKAKKKKTVVKKKAKKVLNNLRGSLLAETQISETVLAETGSFKATMAVGSATAAQGMGTRLARAVNLPASNPKSFLATLRLYAKLNGVSLPPTVRVILLRLTVKKPKAARKKEKRDNALKAKHKEAKHKAEAEDARHKAEHKEARLKFKRKEARHKKADERWTKKNSATKKKNAKARFVPWKGPDILGVGQKAPLATSLEESSFKTETVPAQLRAQKGSLEEEVRGWFH